MATLQDHYNSCLFFSSSVLSRALTREANFQFKAFGLSPTQGFILMTVRKASGISVTDLGAVLYLDHSTITKALEKLELRRLLIRESMGRLTRVFLTVEGEEKEADAKAAWKKTKVQYTKYIGEGEVKHLTGELAKAQRRFSGEE